MRTLAVVAVGGAAGAWVRWGVGAAFDHETGDFPWATLLVNVAGCLAIGVAARRIRRDSDWWSGVVVGGLGGLTTFSAFAVETEALVAAERPSAALGYVVVSVVAGLAATEVARGAPPGPAA